MKQPTKQEKEITEFQEVLRHPSWWKHETMPLHRGSEGGTLTFLGNYNYHFRHWDWPKTIRAGDWSLLDELEFGGWKLGKPFAKLKPYKKPKPRKEEEY